MSNLDTLYLGSGNEDHTLKVLKYFENKLSTNENFSRVSSSCTLTFHSDNYCIDLARF